MILLAFENKESIEQLHGASVRPFVLDRIKRDGIHQFRDRKSVV